MFSFGASPTINITLNDETNRKKQLVNIKGQDSMEIPVYNGNEAVTGQIEILVPPGKKFEHLGIKIEMIGHIGMYIHCLYYFERLLSYYFSFF